jgi:hypothetical protein
MNTKQKTAPEGRNGSPSTVDRLSPAYEPPKITSYTSEEILEQAGPAQACSPAPCGIF